MSLLDKYLLSNKHFYPRSSNFKAFVFFVIFALYSAGKNWFKAKAMRLFQGNVAHFLSLVIFCHSYDDSLIDHRLGYSNICGTSSQQTQKSQVQNILNSKIINGYVPNVFRPWMVKVSLYNESLNW